MAGYPKPRKWTPKNPGKYIGDPNEIWSRSSWELRTFKWLDDNPNVIQWQSEEFYIPYVSPVDNKVHRYFPDILAKIRGSDGRIKIYLIEIKPYSQSIEPKIQKRISKRYITEVCTYAINQAKWKAAKEFCVKKGYIFRVITEKDLFE